MLCFIEKLISLINFFLKNVMFYSVPWLPVLVYIEKLDTIIKIIDSPLFKNDFDGRHIYLLQHFFFSLFFFSPKSKKNAFNKSKIARRQLLPFVSIDQHQILSKP